MLVNVNNQESPFFKQEANNADYDGPQAKGAKALKVWADKVKENPHSFYQNLPALLAKHKWVLTVNNLTFSTVYCPKLLQLKLIAAKYLAKYGIEIVFFEQTKFVEQWEKLKKSLTTPKYLGIIVDNEVNGEGHVVPLVCYFGSSHTEAIILDTLGGSQSALVLQRLLKKAGVSQEHLYSAMNIRQADKLSCRTGGTTILRNALLSLKHHKREGGFATAIREQISKEQVEGQFLNALPIEWDYTDQVTNRSGDNSKVIVIRDLYSKQAGKRQAPRTVAQFRLEHTEENQFACVLKKQGPMLNIAMPPELPNKDRIRFTVSFPVNSYLVNKAARWAKSHKPIRARL